MNGTPSRPVCFALALLLAFAWQTVAFGAEPNTGLPTTAAPIRIAIFDDEGCGRTSAATVEQCFVGLDEFATQRVDAADIRDGALERFDLLVHPGGSGSKQAATLGDVGRENVRRFVAEGGGYMGICAGAYLASADYTWSLHLLNAKVIDRQHWARGTGDVTIRLSPAGQRLLESEELVTVYYGQGPLLGPAGRDDLPTYETLAVFETEIAKKGAPSGVMKGTTAAAAAPYEQGRVFCFSPHPEKSAELKGFIVRAARWTAGQKVAAAAQ